MNASSFFNLTAGDLMSRDLVVFRECTPLRDVARQLVERQISGAPVVDAQGKCLGVVSASDFLRLVARKANESAGPVPGTAITCDFQQRSSDSSGQRIVLCTLPEGACAIQQVEMGPDGRQRLICTQPNTVLVDWQVVEVDHLPRTEVEHFITSDPVLVNVKTPVQTLARMMLDAHIHRLIVVDDAKTPVGIVTSTDLVAAVAYADQNRPKTG